MYLLEIISDVFVVIPEKLDENSVGIAKEHSFLGRVGLVHRFSNKKVFPEDIVNNGAMSDSWYLSIVSSSVVLIIKRS